MITITWVYQRPNKVMPFYQQSTAEAVANQSQFEDLKNNCGLVAGFEKFESDDGLSYTTIWKYDSIDDYTNFIYLVSSTCPDHISSRNDYVIRNNHIISAKASEPVFFVNGNVVDFMVIGGDLMP